MDKEMRWFQMSIGEQIGNIGGEVERAIHYKKKGEPEKRRS